MRPSNSLKKTPLYEEHKKMGAKIVPFAGFYMPLQYSGIIDEHLAVRKSAGLFDVSHMGEFYITGENTLEFVQMVTTNDASKLIDGQAQYTTMCYPSGTIVDDLVIFRISEKKFMFCVNAANIEKDFQWLKQNLIKGVNLENKSDDIALLALQGPEAEKILQNLTKVNLSELKRFRFVQGSVNGIEAMISRTGYTGEDGFELYILTKDAVKLWQLLLNAGKDMGLKPAGLGARDSLRLEAGLLLYGNDITDKTTPIEAGISWTVKEGKGDFIGREELLKQKQEGIKRKLSGFIMLDKGIPRHNYSILKDDKVIGEITSGGYSPILEKGIAMGYIPVELCVPGQKLLIDIRGRLAEMEVVELPFYKRK